MMEQCQMLAALHWGVDNKLYTSGCPGIGVAAAKWLIKQADAARRRQLASRDRAQS
jgi:hypothetical protein